VYIAHFFLFEAPRVNMYKRMASFIARKATGRNIVKSSNGVGSGIGARAAARCPLATVALCVAADAVGGTGAVVGVG
jgi:hypothetical protein